VKEAIKYTDSEITSKLSYLKSRLDTKLSHRKELNKEISELKESLKYWKQFSKSQLKAF